MMKDFTSGLRPLVAFPSQTIATDTTTAGAELSLVGFESCTFVFTLGTFTTGTFTPLIEEKSAGGAFAPVADADLLPDGTGQEAAAVMDATNAIVKIGYRGGPEHTVRASIVSADTASATGVHAIAVLQHPIHAPVG